MSEDTIRVEGTVIETIPNGMFRIELPNGHRVMGFRASRKQQQPIAIGGRVMLEMTSFDMSKARIVGCA